MYFFKSILFLFFWVIPGTFNNGISNTANDKVARVQLCLIVAVSSSMENLLYQAQTQIWQVLDYVEKHQIKKHNTIVEIALITVGNYAPNKNDKTTFLLSGFTTEYSQIADKLFLIKSKGSKELFPEAIDLALNELNWKSDAKLRSIIIAGNEDFNQGSTDWESLIPDMAKKKILVNTLFCGDNDKGKTLSWKQIADETKGRYTNIDQKTTSNIESPYDRQIVELYLKYLGTYNDSTSVQWQHVLVTRNRSFDFAIKPP